MNGILVFLCLLSVSAFIGLNFIFGWNFDEKCKRKHTLKSYGIVFSAIFIAGALTACTSDKSTAVADAKGSNPSNEASATTNDNPSVSGQLKIHFINVGQADSILIQQGSSSMLIDAGNNEDAATVKNYIAQQGITQLDYVIGTHPHEDHVGGLDYVINSFKIGKIYMPKVTTTTQTFQDVITAIKNKGMQITTPIPGSSFKLGEATCTILAPNSSSYEDLNNYSIVIKITFGSNSFLFDGDAGAVSEMEMVNKWYDLKSDLLKVGHHGSITATCANFLSAVSPKYAVISVGTGNSYGHPAQSTMDRLKAANTKVYRTDENGTIILTSNGSDIVFSTQPGSYTGIASSSATTSKSSTTTNEPVQGNRTVYWTSGGKSYHYDRNCRTLARSKSVLEGPASSCPKTDPCDVCAK